MRKRVVSFGIVSSIAFSGFQSLYKELKATGKKIQKQMIGFKGQYLQTYFT